MFTQIFFKLDFLKTSSVNTTIGVFLFVLLVLEVEHRALHMLSLYSTTELYCHLKMLLTMLR